MLKFKVYFVGALPFPAVTGVLFDLLLYVFHVVLFHPLEQIFLLYLIR